MLGVKKYSQKYIDECKSKVDKDLSFYRRMIKAAKKDNDKNIDSLDSAIKSFEHVFFNNMVLVLDSLFVHRLRGIEKKDGNPLNEVRVLCDSIINNNCKMLADKSIKLDPARSILKYQVGDEIKLSENDFTAIAEAFFKEIENKYL
jgi:hypothetical protein